RAHLYALRLEQLLELERMAEKSAQNLLDAIERSKRTTLARLLYALGIRHVGATIAEILAAHFRDIHAVMDAPFEAVRDIPGIGPVIAESVVTFFQGPENRALVQRLLEAGGHPPPHEAPAGGGAARRAAGYP